MRNQIFQKIWDLQTSTPTLKKFFYFTFEDLQNNPEECLKEIEDYLQKHKDKIKDFSFETWLDEETFEAILMLKMDIDESLSVHIYPPNSFNTLLPSSKESMLLRERVTNLFNQYSFDFNSQESRNVIIHKLQYILGLGSVEVIDITSQENIDQGSLNFIVKKDDKEMSLNEYLELVESKRRFE
jgi:hypothetical protein